MGYPVTDITADGSDPIPDPAPASAPAPESGAEQRGAPRYTSLIRSAKLISAQGEFVCVIRDVSSTGISLRAFHKIPGGDRMALELQNGDFFELRKIRATGREGSFTFETPVPVERLINEAWRYPKRQLRLNLAIPLTLTTLTGRGHAITENLSQQGARIDCDVPLAIDQTVRLKGDHLPEIRAKVRWRQGQIFGLVFDTTFALRDFALIAATMQCPLLIDEGAF